MRDDDNALRGIDLDAWAPPPPPPADALADAVVARMREPERSVPERSSAGSPALERSSAGSPAEHASRRWPIAAVAAMVVAVAAAVVIVIVRVQGEPRPPEPGFAGPAVSVPQPQTPPSPTQQPSPPQTPPPTQTPQTPPQADTLDDAAIDRGLGAVSPAIASCDDGTFRGTIRARVTVATDGAVTAVQLRPAGTHAGACLELVLQAALFDATRRGATFERSFDLAGSPATACDAEALEEEGKDRFALGQYAAALQSFERAFACQPDPGYAEKAFIAACNLVHLVKARWAWQHMTHDRRQRSLMICVRNGITEDQLRGQP